MLERITLTPEAALDVAEAYGWYETISPGLGEDFLRSVEAALLIIERHPEGFTVAFDSFRQAMIRRFPYRVFYGISGDTLVVYAVFHCAQNPAKWKHRLTGDPTTEA